MLKTSSQPEHLLLNTLLGVTSTTEANFFYSTANCYSSKGSKRDLSHNVVNEIQPPDSSKLRLTKPISVCLMYIYQAFSPEQKSDSERQLGLVFIFHIFLVKILNKKSQKVNLKKKIIKNENNLDVIKDKDMKKDQN